MPKSKSKFISGAIVGAAMGVASGMALALLKSKEVKRGVEKSKHLVAELYKKSAPKLKKIEKLGEREYRAFMDEAVKNFAKTKKLTGKEAGEVLKEAKKYWKEIKKHL